MAQKTEMVRLLVESQLRVLTGSDQLAPDDDGDYPVRFRDALYYVRVLDDADPVVQVFSVALADIEKSAELLDALNDINCRLVFARTFWVRGQVLFEAEHLGMTLDAEDFINACETIARATDYFAPRLAEQFGGQLLFDESKAETYEQPTVAAAFTGYL